MNILLLTQYYWPEPFTINSLSELLVEQGQVVDVLTGKPNYPEGIVYDGYSISGLQIENKGSINIYRIPIVPRGNKSPIKLALNYFSFILSSCLFAPFILRKRHYDVIFVYAPSPILQAIPAIFLARIKKCSVVLWVQDLWPQSLESTGYVKNVVVLNIIKKVVKFIYSNVTILLVQSKEFIPSVVELAGNTPVIYHPNSVDSSFNLSPPMNELSSVDGLDEGFPIIFAGNIGAGQGIEVIVEAAKLLRAYPHIKFVIFGTGSQWDWLSSQAKEFGLSNMYLPGRFPMDRMAGFMQKASALLVTLADKPNFNLTVPNKLQAYMSIGKPILASINGAGARLVNESRSGLVSDAGNAITLSENILAIFNMTAQERLQMGENALQYYDENFDGKKLVKKLITHFNDAATIRKDIR